MLTLNELKYEILNSDLEDFVDRQIFNYESEYFSLEQEKFVIGRFANKFRYDQKQVGLTVVGSAKIGFALHEKRKPTGQILPRFRPFSAESDIDLAIICVGVFEAIWDELSIHANQSNVMPWNSGKLGDYLVHGWLRPDHFPKSPSLRRCRDWWDFFRDLSANSRLGRRPIRGALFYSEQHLRRYHVRGLVNCRSFLETPS